MFIPSTLNDYQVVLPAASHRGRAEDGRSFWTYFPTKVHGERMWKAQAFTTSMLGAEWVDTALKTICKWVPSIHSPKIRWSHDTYVKKPAALQKKNRTTSLWKKTQPRSLLFHLKRSAQCSIHQGLDPSTFGQPQSASLFSTLASQLWIHLMHLMPVAVHAASSVPIFHVETTWWSD